MPIQTIISTSAARFENWFEDYTRKNLPFTIPMGEGHYLGVIGGPTFDGEKNGKRVHVIKGFHAKPIPSEPDVHMASYDYPVIEVEFFEPSENRLSVSAHCKEPLLIPFFRTMIDSASKYWPELLNIIKPEEPKGGL